MSSDSVCLYCALWKKKIVAVCVFKGGYLMQFPSVTFQSLLINVLPRIINLFSETFCFLLLLPNTN